MSKKIKLFRKRKHVISNIEELTNILKRKLNPNYLEHFYPPDKTYIEDLAELVSFVYGNSGHTWRYSVYLYRGTNKIFIGWTSSEPSQWDGHDSPFLNKLLQNYKWKGNYPEPIPF